MAWIPWKLDNLNMHPDPIAEAVKQLAGSIQELACAMRQIALGAEKNATLERLVKIEGKIDDMAETQKDVAAKLRDVNTRLQKISGESTENLRIAKELKEKLENGDADPELISAANALVDQAQKLDDLTPDVNPNPENPPSDVPTP